VGKSDYDFVDKEKADSFSKNPMYDTNGKLIGVLGVSRDITERKNSEDILLQAKLDAEAANQTKSEFLANMSHELRTPLNSIFRFSQMLNERVQGDLNDKQASYVSNIMQISKHLIDLINDILDLSKVEAGKMKLEREILMD
jgi:signal transduction histidine kinase